jgi:hypothetical protein
MAGLRFAKLRHPAGRAARKILATTGLAPVGALNGWLPQSSPTHPLPCPKGDLKKSPRHLGLAAVTQMARGE